MNQYIKQYAADCQSTSLGNYSFDVERFAERLIEDFISICETQSNGEDVVKDIVVETKQYFGVK